MAVIFPRSLGGVNGKGSVMVTLNVNESLPMRLANLHE